MEVQRNLTILIAPETNRFRLKNPAWNAKGQKRAGYSCSQIL